MLTWPPVPTGTKTRLGIVCPAVQFKFDELGWATPLGHTVRKLVALVRVTVTLRIAADTPFTGAPPAPVTCTLRVVPALRVMPALGCPLPGRVSVIRAGVRATSPPALPLGAEK